MGRIKHEQYATEKQATKPKYQYSSGHARHASGNSWKRSGPKGMVLYVLYEYKKIYRYIIWYVLFVFCIPPPTVIRGMILLEIEPLNSLPRACYRTTTDSNQKRQDPLFDSLELRPTGRDAMDGSDNDAGESRRWTCEACGCNTNSEIDRACSICGTSNGMLNSREIPSQFWNSGISGTIFQIDCCLMMPR